IRVRVGVTEPRMERGADGWRERAIRDAVLAGDPAAWRAWYDEHFDRLAGYVGWRCGGLRDLADDVLQETWLTAVRRLRTFDPARGPFFAWLCGIAANAARSAVRNRLRRMKRSRPLAAAPEPRAATPPAADDPPAGVGLPRPAGADRGRRRGRVPRRAGGRVAGEADPPALPRPAARDRRRSRAGGRAGPHAGVGRVPARAAGGSGDRPAGRGE